METKRVAGSGARHPGSPEAASGRPEAPEPSSLSDPPESSAMQPIWCLNLDWPRTLQAIGFVLGLIVPFSCDDHSAEQASPGQAWGQLQTTRPRLIVIDGPAAGEGPTGQAALPMTGGQER